MSVARPSQCVFCLFRRSARPVISRKRSLHTTPTRRKEKTDEKVDEKSNQKTEKKPTVEKLDITKEGRRFRQIKKGEWEQNYSPEQVEAIEAASKLINPENFKVGKGAPRTDPWSMNYYDNFEKINPVVDKPIRAPMTNIDDTQRMKTEEEFDQDLAKLMENLPASEQEGVKMFEEFDKNLRLTTGREEAERNPPSAMAPMIPSPETATKKRELGVGDKTPEPALIQLMQMTGFSQEEIRGLRVKTVLMRIVTNQTRLGKIRSMYYLTIAGNRNGLLGIGEGKASEAPEARLQSHHRAIRSMKPILRYENRTIFGDVKGKVGATELELYARPPGKLFSHSTTLALTDLRQDSVSVSSSTSGRLPNAPVSMTSTRE